LVKVRVMIVSYAVSCDTAVSDLSEVDEPDRLAGARPWPQRPPRSFHPPGGGSDPPCWRLPFTSRSSVSVSPSSTRKRRPHDKSWATHSHSPVREGSPDIPMEGVMQEVAYLLRRILLPRRSCIREERKGEAPLFAPRPSSCSSLRLLHH
jgi:hypothetical protein